MFVSLSAVFWGDIPISGPPLEELQLRHSSDLWVQLMGAGRGFGKLGEPP